MANGFRINRQGIQQLQRDLEREFARHPVRVPLEGDTRGVTFPSSTTVNNYHGPVVTVNGDHTQLAWNNEAVNQNQARVEEIAPGYETIARVLTALLAAVNDLGLQEDEVAELTSNAEAVLEEITKPEPERTLVKRGVTMLMGLLAPIVTGVKEAVSDESADLARTFIEGLGTLPF